MGKMIDSTAAAAQLGVSIQRARVLCRERRIKGARLIGRSWFVPADFSVTPGTRGPKPKAPETAD